MINKAVFLAPKVYGFICEDGTEVIKVKGLSSETLKNVHINDLEHLLHKDSSLQFNQEKWFKKVFEGEISVNEIAYTLKATSNKRSPIYINQDGVEIFNSTEPYNYEEIS